MIASFRHSPSVRRLVLALLWLAPVGLSGCGGAVSTSVPVYPTSGQVLSQGKPLAGVQVTFRPISPDGTASSAPVPLGKTDQDGKFRLTTSVGANGLAVDGAPAGDYVVALVSAGRSDSVDFLRKDAALPTSSPINARFADPKTSGLKATIKPGENTLEPFDLKDASAGAAQPSSGGAARPSSRGRE